MQPISESTERSSQLVLYLIFVVALAVFGHSFARYDSEYFSASTRRDSLVFKHPKHSDNFTIPNDKFTALACSHLEAFYGYKDQQDGAKSYAFPNVERLLLPPPLKEAFEKAKGA